MIVKADKENSIIILKVVDYNNKINDFINSNNFTPTNTDPTNVYHKRIRKGLNSSKTMTKNEN
jgi:hypothetical protein